MPLWRNYATLATTLASRETHDECIGTDANGAPAVVGTTRSYAAGKLFDALLSLHSKAAAAVREAALFACERAGDATLAVLVNSLRTVERTLGVKLTKVEADQLTFADANGLVYVKGI